MALDKETLTKLRKYAQVFKQAAERSASESDTVMYLVKFFEEVFGYDSLAGEISREVAIKDRYCDIGIRLEGAFRFLVEAKASDVQALRDKDIEQAENYASRSGLQWVLLTNGIEWQVYHLTFAEKEGIKHELAFAVNLADGLESDPTALWECLRLLSKQSVLKGELEKFWEQRKALAPATVVRAIFSECGLKALRRELYRTGKVWLQLEDVFVAVKDILDKGALLSVGDISVPRHRKKRRKVKPDPTTSNAEQLGQTPSTPQRTAQGKDEGTAASGTTA